MAQERMNQGASQQRGTEQSRTGEQQRKQGTGEERGRQQDMQLGGGRTGLSRRESGAPSFWRSGLAGSPFGLMRRMMEDMDRMFDDFGFGRQLAPMERFQGGSSGSLWSPQVEVLERDGNLIVRADLPGMKQEDIRVEVQNDTLILEGERKQEKEEERGGLWRSERSYGSFCRMIPLPEGIDVQNATACFDNGVLEICAKLPQQQQQQQSGRRIEVQKGPANQGGQGELSQGQKGGQKPPVH